jgi:hypothetical protein
MVDWRTEKVNWVYRVSDIVSPDLVPDNYEYYGVTYRTLKERLDEEKRDNNWSDGFIETVIDKPLYREDAETIEAGLIAMNKQDIGDLNLNIALSPTKLERWERIKDSCPICIDIGCSIDEKYIESLLNPIVKCHICGSDHNRAHKPDGNYICHKCYDKYYRPKVPMVKCHICGVDHKRGSKPDGNYVCHKCYKKLLANKNGFDTYWQYQKSLKK